jgi:Fur family transcriptional regulator, ferric uptake regulator
VASTDQRLTSILDLVRARGGRITTPRRAIITALLAADNEHVTAEQLADTVQQAHPDVHRSTVYRTLDALSEMGVIGHVHLGHSPAVYHFTDEYTDQPHHHMVCQDCGRVVELPLSVLTSLQASISRDYGFDLDATHFALTGRCSDCR